MAAMESSSAKNMAAFTLLEVCIAILIAVLIIGAAIPSIQGALSQNREKTSFDGFDRLAQEAHSRSVSEQKVYCLVWQKDGVILRPEEASASEADGVDRWDLPKNGKLVLELPAALKPKPVDAIWTFWPSGVCEPASVFYADKNVGWQAVYNPFTSQANVKYD